jgi:hypothetical protein
MNQADVVLLTCFQCLHLSRNGYRGPTIWGPLESRVNEDIILTFIIQSEMESDVQDKRSTGLSRGKEAPNLTQEDMGPRMRLCWGVVFQS